MARTAFNRNLQRFSQATAGLSNLDADAVAKIKLLDSATLEKLKSVDPTTLDNLKKLNQADFTTLASLKDSNIAVLQQLATIKPKVVSRLVELEDLSIVGKLTDLEGVFNELKKFSPEEIQAFQPIFTGLAAMNPKARSQLLIKLREMAVDQSASAAQSKKASS